MEGVDSRSLSNGNGGIESLSLSAWFAAGVLYFGRFTEIYLQGMA